MNLIRKELKENFRSVLIWVSIISILIIMIILLHPVAIEKMDMMNEMIEQFPKELLKAFNIDANTTFQNILNFFFYEFQFILVAGVIFAGALATNIIAKEENDKTIQFLYSKPISRSDILLSKLSVVLLYLLIFNIIIFSITSVTMHIVSNQDINNLLLLNIFVGQMMIQITFSFIGILIATSLKKVKAATAITNGIIITTFILGIISKIADKISILSYISPMNYLLNDNFMKIGHVEVKYIIIMLVIVMLSAIISMTTYVKKDFTI